MDTLVLEQLAVNVPITLGVAKKLAEVIDEQ